MKFELFIITKLFTYNIVTVTYLVSICKLHVNYMLSCGLYTHNAK